MMKKMIKTSCALAVLAASCNVMADTIDMRISGSVRPVACKPSLSSEGVVDYGIVSLKKLNKDDYTRLADKELTLTITCTAPAKVTLMPVSARKGTGLLTGPEGPVGSAAPVIDLGMHSYSGAVGLGLNGEKKVGGYAIALTNVVLDNIAAKTLQSNNKINWRTGNSSSLYHANGGPNYISWFIDGDITPAAFESMTGKITVKPYINKLSELDVTKPIKMDGLSVIEMIYL